MNKLRKTLMLALLVITVLVVTVAPAAAKHINEYEGQHIH